MINVFVLSQLCIFLRWLFSYDFTFLLFIFYSKYLFHFLFIFLSLCHLPCLIKRLLLPPCLTISKGCFHFLNLCTTLFAGCCCKCFFFVWDFDIIFTLLSVPNLSFGTEMYNQLNLCNLFFIMLWEELHLL